MLVPTIITESLLYIMYIIYVQNVTKNIKGSLQSGKGQLHYGWKVRAVSAHVSKDLLQYVS